VSRLDLRSAAERTRARDGRTSWSLGSLRSWSTREIVIAAVLAVAVGVVFWTWDLLWATAFAAVPFPVSYLLVGIWMIGGLLIPYVVRKPGAALVGELVAAFVSMILVNQWGFAVMLSGLVQGVGAELIFAASGYRRYSLPVLMAAGALAGVFSIFLDSFVYSYWHIYSLGSILLGVVLVALSGALLGGLLSKALADGLARTGVLSGLAISRGARRRLG
jgi:energy-coupling factor transport system substrate-specific component